MTTTPKSKFVAFLLLARLLTAPVSGSDFLIDRDRIDITTTPAPSARFTVRLTEIDAIKTAEALVGGQKAEVKLDPVEEKKTSVYFLVDTSLQEGGSFAKEQAAAVAELADLLLVDSKSESLFEVGIGTIGSNFKDWGYSLRSKDARGAILDKLVTAKGDATSEIYRCSIEALEKFKVNATGGRKAVVLLSSGKSTDQGKDFSSEKLISLAKSEGIPVFVVGYSVNPANSSTWQSLRIVAKETGGSFIETRADHSTLKDIGAEFKGIMNATKVVTVDLKNAKAGKQPMVVTLGLNGPTKLTVEREIEVPVVDASQTPAPAKPGETKPGEVGNAAKPGNDKPEKTQGETNGSRSVIDSYTSKPWFLPAAVGGGVLGLTLIGFLIFKLTRTPDTASFPTGGLGTGTTWEVPPDIFNNSEAPGNESIQTTADTGISRMGTTVVIGWLEQLDKAGNLLERHPMKEGKVTIGRSSDNDLSFNHESVSVHHANVHRRSDKSLAVTDLRSSNGVYVNNKRVEHSVLKHGDVVELGEIRLRVAMNQTGY